MVDETLDKSKATPSVGTKTTGGYACSTYMEPGASRTFDPDSSWAGWRSAGLGLEDSDMDDDTLLQPA